jgi:hypothetical protein
VAADLPAFGLALRDDVDAAAARETLERLAFDDDFRASVASDPRALYDALGIDVGEGLLPEKVVLPLKRELMEALEILDTYGEFRLKFEPFGFYTPARNPFIGVLLLAARVNAGS